MNYLYNYNIPLFKQPIRMDNLKVKNVMITKDDSSFDAKVFNKLTLLLFYLL